MFLEKDGDDIHKILEIINNTTLDFKDIPSIDQMIKNRYGLKLDDVREWLSLTEWSQEQLSENELKNIQDQLFKLDLIKKQLSTDSLLYNF